jgi:hypothetical protein
MGGEAFHKAFGEGHYDKLFWLHSLPTENINTLESPSLRHKSHLKNNGEISNIASLDQKLYPHHPSCTPHLLIPR